MSNKNWVGILIPAYNEEKNIKNVINEFKNYGKIFIVDDGSTDGSSELIKSRFNEKNVKLIFHKGNKGKGAAIRSALKYIQGDIVLIQDADLEYDPNDYYKLLEPFKKSNVKVVYGSRVLKKKRYSIKKSFPTNFRVFANHILTIFSNLINQQKSHKNIDTVNEFISQNKIHFFDLSLDDFQKHGKSKYERLTHNNYAIVDYGGLRWTERRNLFVKNQGPIFYICLKRLPSLSFPLKD